MGYNIDPITNQVALNITDFAIPEDKESAILLWNQQVTDLKRILGA
ncbi:MAG: START-like domain-containing protein [Bacteroidota bacterium]